MFKLRKNMVIIATTGILILGNSVTALAYENYQGKDRLEISSADELKGRKESGLYVEREDPYLVINVDGIDEKTKELLLMVPFFEWGVKPGETIKYEKIIDLIQTRVNYSVGNNIYKVKGFEDGTHLKEGYSETLVELVNGKDITFPMVSKDIKQPKYSIVGNILLEKLPEVEKPKDMIDNIEVIYTPEFFLKSNDDSVRQLSLFPDVELGELNAGHKISADELKKYAQDELDKKFGKGKYIIESRRLAFSRNITQGNINTGYELLSELELNEDFEYEVKSQYKDIEADKYQDLIVDKFYVREKGISNEVAKNEINTNTENLNFISDNDKLNNYQDDENTYYIENINIYNEEILNILENMDKEFNRYFNQYQLENSK
ncbi:hypothetical protein [Clostridium sp. CCUG 7971]|uniref:hypothetical protein n=1 Tax=Clostridium sp. CCUG 7971 TaxID=2811414 RepID=UPI001ABB6202|nr:hypothetical protein [Clostridium sp. CCUG 7971]MBO3444163.1 hypothetical protein [Clostridium sp. CCUG 7971]